MRIISNIKTFRKALSRPIKHHLRKVNIFKRLNVTFLLLLLSSSLFLTFFAYFQYSAEINLNLDRYVSLLVQNVTLKTEDIMATYEDVALRFYDDNQVIHALMENASLPADGTSEEQTQYKKNAYTIESKLYSMGFSRKHITNIQFITPDNQYHMVEPMGYQRGGSIRDLESFYESEFYLLPKEKKGYPTWIDNTSQATMFYKNEQSIYGLANIITLGVAVYAPGSRDFLGVLILNIDLNAFTHATSGYESYNDGNIFLIGKDGVIDWFSPSITAPSFPKNQALFSDMVQKKYNILRTKIDKRPVILAYEQITGTDVFITYVADLSVLLGRTYRIRNISIAMLFSIVIASFIASYYVTISISDPIKQLVKTMVKTGDGAWSARYDNSGKDEITILGDRFNEMADKTNQLIEQVYISEINRQRTLISWKNAQLSAMLMQINPHFLYNTLDIIRWEAMYEANGESTVTQMIEKFSRLCRVSMRIGSNTVTLREGIEHASNYMDIINFRHQDKIQVTIHTKVDTNHIYIPQFILQPILENAIIHAFDNASKGYHIQIDAYHKDDRLFLTVKDNGKGMTTEELKVLQDSLTKGDTTESIGLVNVHQRIQLFYGEAYCVNVSSAIDQGTQVEVTLPLRSYSENMENYTEEWRQL